MPLTKRGKLKKEKKLNDYRENLSKETGIYFSPELTTEEKDTFPFLKYFINALILFGAVFGSLDCIVSAFHIEVTVVPLMIICGVLALILSFMYVSKRAKILTYLGLFVLIVFSITTFFVVLNSGISALRNHIMSYINEHSGLPFLREYTIYYDDEYIAMSLALCVLAVAIMILLNIVVSEKMSFRGIFYLTFPFAQCGMYFGYSVSKFAMICVITSWLLVAVVEFTNSYNGLTRTMIASSSVKKHRHSYGFITDSQNVSKIALVWLVVLFMISAITFTILPTDSFEVNLPTNKIKDRTERVVKNYLAYGLSSMWSMDKTASEPGSLSNVSEIAFDGRTDLEVTLVNYRQDRIYIRSYVGYNYDGNKLQWVNPEGVNSAEKQYKLTPDLLKYDYEHNQLISKSWHRIDIEVKDIDLAEKPIYIPYYSYPQGDNTEYITSGEVKNKEVIYKPEAVSYDVYTLDVKQEDYSQLIDSIDDEALKAEYTETLEAIKNDAYDNALEVPENNIKAIENFCTTYNIKATDEDVIGEVISALENNFEYTLRPGKVPYGEDYVNYFLNANLKGYCQHFATAATLIFRYLGVPARYAEGYAIDRGDFYTGEDIYKQNLLDWIITPYTSDLMPVKISVPDSSGHAWVEVFEDGIGWVTVEATVAPSADGGNNLLQNLFGRGNNFGINGNALAERVKEINTEKTKSRLAILLITVIAAFMAAYIVKVIVIISKRYRSFTGNYSVALGNRFKHIYSIWQFKENKENINLSYLEFFNLLSDEGVITEDGNKVYSQYEQILFSGENADINIYNALALIFRNAERNLFKQMKLKQKLSFIFVKILW